MLPRFPRSLLLFLYFIIQIPLNILAEVCPKPEISSKLTQKTKTCPDFKDEPNRMFCCPSNVQIGTFYCCTQEDIDRFKSLESAKAWKEFLKNYLALIILSSLVSICLLVLLTSVLCKRIRKCPLYRDGNALSHSAQAAASMYRPVDTIPPKIYEAPPPYEVAFPVVDQSRNDWNCLLENEVNVGRREAPPTM